MHQELHVRHPAWAQLEIARPGGAIRALLLNAPLHGAHFIGHLRRGILREGERPDDLAELAGHADVSSEEARFKQRLTFPRLRAFRVVAPAGVERGGQLAPLALGTETQVHRIEVAIRKEARQGILDPLGQARVAQVAPLASLALGEIAHEEEVEIGWVEHLEAANSAEAENRELRLALQVAPRPKRVHAQVHRRADTHLCEERQLMHHALDVHGGQHIRGRDPEHLPALEPPERV